MIHFLKGAGVTWKAESVKPEGTIVIFSVTVAIELLELISI